MGVSMDTVQEYNQNCHNNIPETEKLISAQFIVMATQHASTMK